MSYTLGQASKATGKSKSTILRAIESGRLSGKKNPATGDWDIDPAELHRVYPPVAETVAKAKGTEQAFLIEELRQGWSRERALLERTIDDLRNHVEAIEEERRGTLRQLTALLTDQREKTAIPMPSPVAANEPTSSPEEAPAKRKWRLFGR